MAKCSILAFGEFYIWRITHIYYYDAIVDIVHTTMQGQPVYVDRTTWSPCCPLLCWLYLVSIGQKWYTSTHTHACTHKRTHAHTHARMHTHTHACTHTCTHAHAHMHTHAQRRCARRSRTHTSLKTARPSCGTATRWRTWKPAKVTALAQGQRAKCRSRLAERSTEPTPL